MNLTTLANNQTVVKTSDRITFFSYDTKIAEYDIKTDALTLSNKWDFSNTTRKHFANFINDFTPYQYISKSQWIDFIHKCTMVKITIEL